MQDQSKLGFHPAAPANVLKSHAWVGQNPTSLVNTLQNSWHHLLYPPEHSPCLAPEDTSRLIFKKVEMTILVMIMLVLVGPANIAGAARLSDAAFAICVIRHPRLGLLGWLTLRPCCLASDPGVLLLLAGHTHTLYFSSRSLPLWSQRSSSLSFHTTYKGRKT